MIPWLCVQGFCFVVSLMTLIVNLIFGDLSPKMRFPGVINLLVHLACIGFINMGMKSFRYALTVDQVEDLMLSIRQMETIIEYSYFIIKNRVY